MRYIHLRLIEKPSEPVLELDLSRASVGDIVVVTPASGVRLMAKGYAVEVPPSPLVDPRVIYPPSRATVS